MRALSKSTIYCLRALIYVASKNEQENYVNIGEISEELNISFHFLTKTFQILTKKGLLESHRGPHGGVMLKKPIKDIYLIEIVHILEGEDFFEKCLLGLPGCGSNEPCPVHGFWKNVKGSLQKEFEETSLAHLSKGIKTKKMRI
ncbi:MAG: Rrf2 family transcriptional regulator [Saprospiraceae bacterium]|nr:Rrf2 family transcriptional regulator [Saprospiraceae bacterium]MBK8448606.1 Rrf2 family transcriptional regulator [Saprospiraceae bacterium]MBK8482889.1 Rrf2 family transcriptional regulator [Saprospiraceae bacterium]MBK9722750.1 Rrf2 family transcriptional regulator [Saprospiraceae bacterium]MBK9726654.1 Rrf2 family transcriptional regulator [Saprospiraceae bacterium]